MEDERISTVNEQGLYVYCIGDNPSPKSFGKIGIGGEEVYTFPFNDICAVTSRTSSTKYEPNEENALIHMTTILRVMQDYAVLPFRFGTAFKSEDGLRIALSKIYDECKKEFTAIGGKVEVGVKVVWQAEAAIQETKRSSQKLTELEKEIEKNPQGVAYLLRVKFNELLKDELNAKADQFSSNIYDELKKEAANAVQSRLVGHMILNGAFLVDSSKVEGFRSVVKKLESEYQQYGLKILFSGPWPPYNFVNIRYE